MRALITRPEDDSISLRHELERRGVAVMVEPMLTVVPVAGARLDLDGVQGLMFTSSNGVRAFAALSDRRDLAAWAVGDATAGSCRAAGFATVFSAGGDVEDLTRLVTRRCRPEAGRLLHVAGSVSAGDLAGGLRKAGFAVDRVPLYEARPATGLGDRLKQALIEGALDAVLFFSPRTAATFVTLVQAAGLGARCRRIDALCLSQAVAGKLGALAWHGIRVATKPTQEALLALFDAPDAFDRPPTPSTER